MNERVRDAAALALRPVPARLLTAAAARGGGGAAAKVMRQGLRHRTVQIRQGRGAGLWINPGPSNPDYALGTNEPAVQEALAVLLAPGSVLYDVGANVGFLAALAARLVGPEGAVYAFEPDAANAAMARHNLALNGADGAVVVCRAVGATSGLSTLQLAAYAGGHALTSAAAPPDQVAAVTVEVVALDDFVALPGVRPPDVVKIDVEGAELDVLAGMAGLLATRAPVLLLELDAASAAEHERKAAEVAAWLTAHCYDMSRLPDGYPGDGWVVSHWVCRGEAGC